MDSTFLQANNYKICKAAEEKLEQVQHSSDKVFEQLQDLSRTCIMLAINTRSAIRFNELGEHDAINMVDDVLNSINRIRLLAKKQEESLDYINRLTRHNIPKQ